MYFCVCMRPFSFVQLHRRLLKNKCVNRGSENLHFRFQTHWTSAHFILRLYARSLCRCKSFLTALIYTTALSHKICYWKIIFDISNFVGQGRVNGNATRYVLDNPNIKPRRRRYFLHLSRPVLGPTQPLIQCVPGFFPRVKRPGHSANHQPLSGTQVKERVELYVCPLLGLPGLL